MTQERTSVSTTPPLPGLELVQQINEALATVASDFAGDDDPAALAMPYARWADTGTGRWRMRNAAGTAWIDLGPLAAEDAVPVDGAVLASQAWVLARTMPTFLAGTEPTTNAGDIWINGVGACRWDAGDARYWLIPTYTNSILVTASGTVARPGAYVKYGQWDGCGGGGSGGRGSTVGSGRSSGGGGGAAIFREAFTFSDTPMSITIGAGGAGPGGASSPTAGNDGGATVFNGVTLGGGKAGASSNTLNVEGGEGGTSASPRTVPGQFGDYASTSNLLSSGGSSGFGFGLGGRNGRPNTTGTAWPEGYGAGSGGVGGSNTNAAASGFIRIWY
ncbi:glycine-rich domain-containing protein [Achromobacter veterisilvae]|uniref:Glycine-rich domain-containing protein n=1 Tax=Achromobacter veterisilvae TaxID=2069367 RepID=A0ABZ2S6J3_9BURK